jgi:hypothetical protein
MAWTLDAVNPVIFQTGTDTDLTGLASISGVTTSLKGTKIIYNTGGRRIVVNGNLSFNANIEAINWDVGSPIPELIINNGNSLTISGERTVGTLTFNTQAIGLAIGRTGATTFAPSDSWVTNNGLFTLNGAGVNANSVIAMGGKFVANEALLQNRTLGANFRYQSAQHEINGLRMENLNTTLINTAPAQLNGLSMVNGAFTFVTLPGNQPTAPRLFAEQGVTGGPPTFTNFGTANNYVEFKNYANWDGLVMGMNFDTNFSFKFTKDIELEYNTLAGINIEGAIIYIPDNDNGNRPAFYPDDEPLISVTNAQGKAIGKRLALIANLTTNTGPNADKITPDLDFRNPNNDDTGSDTLYLFSYGFVPLRIEINLKGNDVLNVPVTATADANITLSENDARAKLASSFDIDLDNKVVTITDDSTYDDIYDALVAFKVKDDEDNLSAPSTTDLQRYIVTPNGSNLVAFNDWELIVNNGVTLDRGIKFTKIKFSDVTINGNGKITGLYETDLGTSTIFSFGRTEAPIPNGCSLAIWDNNGNTLFFEADTDEDTYSFYIPPMTQEIPYNFAVERYGFRRFAGAFPSNAGEELRAAILFNDDIGITELDLSVVQGYSIINNLENVYDLVASYRLTENGIKSGDIVVRDGLFLDFLGRDVVFDDQAQDIVDVNNGTLTLRGLVINSTAKYTSAKTEIPGTIEPTDDEQLNFIIEDANGDSQLTILGGDNEGYQLWKVPTTTATDDFETGDLLITLPNNLEPFRFIGITGFDIVGRDISSGVRRRSSMLKGVYTQAFYVGNEIQLATDAPQLVENNTKLDSLIVELTSIKGTGWASSSDTLKQISLRDAQTQVKIDNLGQPLQANAFIAPDNTGIQEIKTKVDTLENPDLSSLALESTNQDIKTKVDQLENYDDTVLQGKVDQTLKASDYVVPDNATIQNIDSKIDNLETGATIQQIESSNVIAKESSVQSLGNPLQASDYVAPDNAKIEEVNVKVNDSLEGIEKASLLIPFKKSNA